MNDERMEHLNDAPFSFAPDAPNSPHMASKIRRSNILSLKPRKLILVPSGGVERAYAHMCTLVYFRILEYNQENDFEGGWEA